MNFPQRGSQVVVEGYGSAVFAGASVKDDEESVVLLKFEGHGLDEGYGNGIITVSLEYFEENRVYPEQVANDEPLVESTEKRDRILRKRLED